MFYNNKEYIMNTTERDIDKLTYTLEMDEIVSEIVFDYIKSELSFISDIRHLDDIVKIQLDLSPIYSDLEVLAVIIKKYDEFNSISELSPKYYISFLLDTLFSLSSYVTITDHYLMESFKEQMYSLEYEGGSIDINYEALMANEEDYNHLKQHIKVVNNFFTDIVRSYHDINQRYLSFIGKRYIDDVKRRIIVNIVAVS